MIQIMATMITTFTFLFLLVLFFFCIIKQTKWKKAHKDSRISIAAECSGVCDWIDWRFWYNNNNGCNNSAPHPPCPHTHTHPRTQPLTSLAGCRGTRESWTRIRSSCSVCRQFGLMLLVRMESNQCNAIKAIKFRKL